VTVWTFVGAALLIVGNGLFVAVEFALLASLRTRLEPFAEEGRRSARRALDAMGHLGPVLAGTQLGVTMCSLALGSVAEPAVSHLLESLLGRASVPEGVAKVIGFVFGLGTVVFFHLLFGEMVPKSVALTAPESTLMVLVGPTQVFVWIFRPIIWALNAMARLGARALGATPADELRSSHTSAELSVMLGASLGQGLLDEDEVELLTGAIEFVARSVDEVMVPRERMVSIDAAATVGEAEETIRSSGHSRLLVTNGDIDHVAGFVHAKDLIGLDEVARTGSLPLRLRRHLTVPPTVSLGELLVEMQERQIHLAVVVGARTLGMVTLEDILESIVGDILDESVRPTGHPPRADLPAPRPNRAEPRP